MVFFLDFNRFLFFKHASGFVCTSDFSNHVFGICEFSELSKWFWRFKQNFCFCSKPLVLNWSLPCWAEDNSFCRNYLKFRFVEAPCSLDFQCCLLFFLFNEKLYSPVTIKLRKRVLNSSGLHQLGLSLFFLGFEVLQETLHHDLMSVV